MLRTRWTPSPCDRLSRPPRQVVTPATTTGPPPHPNSSSRQRTFPSGQQAAGRRGAVEVVPTFTLQPFVGLGARLCPCSIATPTPQTSVWPPCRRHLPAREFPAHAGARCDPAHIRQVRAGGSLERRCYAGSPSLHLPVSLAGPAPSDGAGTSRLRRGCLPPFPAFPGSGCPQLHQPCCDRPEAVSFHHRTVESASWRSISQLQHWFAAVAISSGLTCAGCVA